ncbi:MAG: phosphopyruvate hydratase [Candidatus Freyarchaeota archaeon]|nr:phosphopyruvate hydratase [Candidatus Jordarchaeia archaeon]
MSEIREVRARKILDSRGNPTIKAIVYTGDAVASACAPSGASVGRFEAQAFPRGGVDESINMIESLSNVLKGMSVDDQASVDEAIRMFDGTENFSRLGGNAAIATSVAVAKAAAAIRGIPLCKYFSAQLETPFPLSNIIGGGVHTKGKSIDFQEFLVLPVGARSFSEAVDVNVMVHREVSYMLTARLPKYVLGKNDEGAWAAPLSVREALEILSSAAQKVEGETGVKIRIGIDAAASGIWSSEKKAYVYRKEGFEKTSEQQLEYISSLIEEYGIAYFEDPFHEEDFDSFAKLKTSLGGKCIVTGDDLTVTNEKRIRKATESNAINAVIIKPNQIGTLTDTRMAVELALSKKITPVASHRSGETCDPALAHIAIGMKCPVIKIGIMGGERMAKINEIMRIEEELRVKMAKPPV